MNKENTELRVPYGMAVHDDKEENAVLEIMKNHKTIMGDKVKQFENEISTLFGKELGIMVNSGSSANLLAFEVLDIPENSEVITPILTFATTLSPIIKTGLTPVFVDVRDDFNINPDLIEPAITKATKAIVPMHFCGSMCEMDRICGIAEKHKIQNNANVLHKTEIINACAEQTTEKEEELKVKQGELKKIIKETEKEEVALMKDSSKAEKVIDERLLNAYKRIRSKVANGLAVVSVERDACGGCFSQIPPQRQLDIQMHKKVIVCEHCGRIMVDANIFKEQEA